jgi:hypothetical protein
VRPTWLASLAFLSAISCSAAKMAPVSGTVSVAGKPVDSGMILFTPENGPTATGEIVKGAYTLTTTAKGDGALVGKHKVTIQAVTVGPMIAVDMPQPKSLDEESEMARKAKGRPLIPGEVKFVVPERYSNMNTTDLSRDVVPGQNTIDFDLPAK